LLLIAAAVCGGTFGAIHKQSRLCNEVFVMYMILFGMAPLQLLSVLILPPLRMEVGFTHWGIVAGIALYFVQLAVFKTFELAGVALGSSLLAGAVIILSMLSDLLLFGHRVSNAGELGGALFLIVFGLGGMCLALLLSAPPRDAPLAPSGEAKGVDGARALLTLLSALAAGALFVFVSAIESQAPPELRGLAFTWSQAAGVQLAAFFLTFPVFFAVHRRAPNGADFGQARELALAAASGATLGLGLLLLDTALSFGIADGVANSVFQTNVFVAGLWGILLYGEVRGRLPLLIYLVAVALLFTGIALEAMTGV
jgi:glucose uptake protein GlcU